MVIRRTTVSISLNSLTWRRREELTDDSANRGNFSTKHPLYLHSEATCWASRSPAFIGHDPSETATSSQPKSDLDDCTFTWSRQVRTNSNWRKAIDFLNTRRAEAGSDGTGRAVLAILGCTSAFGSSRYGRCFRYPCCRSSSSESDGWARSLLPSRASQLMNWILEQTDEESFEIRNRERVEQDKGLKEFICESSRLSHSRRWIKLYADETNSTDLRNLQAKFHELERLARDLLDARPHDDRNDSIPPSSPRQDRGEEESDQTENGERLHFATKTNLDASTSPETTNHWHSLIFSRCTWAYIVVLYLSHTYFVFNRFFM